MLMRGILGATDLIVAGICFLGALLAILGLDLAWENYEREPEDLWLLVFLTTLSVILGALFCRLGWYLARGASAGRSSPGLFTATATILVIVVLAAISLLPAIRPIDPPRPPEWIVPLILAALLTGTLWMVKRVARNRANAPPGRLPRDESRGT